MSDIALYTQDSTGSGVQALITDFSSGAEAIGPTQMAQRFMLKLLKTTTSSKYFADGCSFLSNLQTNVLTEFEVFAAFSSALAEIYPLMKAEENDDTPLDERFTGASIIELALAQDGLVLSIAVFNQAGTAVGLRLPMEIS